jgi:hypothetical protein
VVRELARTKITSPALLTLPTTVDNLWAKLKSEALNTTTELIFINLEFFYILFLFKIQKNFI